MSGLELSTSNRRKAKVLRPRLEVIKNDAALNGAFTTDDQTSYLDAWQNVDSNEGVPLAVAGQVFGYVRRRSLKNSTRCWWHE
jgi:hypothetical protein